MQGSKPWELRFTFSLKFAYFKAAAQVTMQTLLFFDLGVVGWLVMAAGGLV